MTELDLQYRRWTELMDRRADGVQLSADEEAFCQSFAAQHPACEREEALLAELADLDAAPTAESRALVDATLARMADEAVKAERAELSRLRNGTRVPRMAWALAGAVAAAAVALVIALPRKHVAPPPVATAVRIPAPAARVELVYASGDVRVNGVQLTPGSAVLLAEGSRVSVGAGAAACLAMDPDIDVCARAQSELLLSRTHSPWRRVDLLHGKVGVQLAPQPAGYQFSIVARDVWSTAVGTAFTVANEGDRPVRTAVMNGKVRVGRDGAHEQLVATHQRSEVRGAQSLVAAIGRGEESSEWALLRPAALWHNLVSSTLVVRGESAAGDVAEVVLDEQTIGVAPLTTLIPAGSHRVQVRVQGQTVLDRQLVSEVGQVSTVEYGAVAPSLALAEATHALRGHAARRPTPRAHVAPAPEPESAAEMMREAHRLMRGQSFELAAKQYEALRAAHPDAPEASAVLVSLAELQLDRLGRPAAALATLDEYLSGHGGALAEEARQVRIRALRALGERTREASAIDEFLRLHPRSFRAPALQRRLAELEGSNASASSAETR